MERKRVDVWLDRAYKAFAIIGILWMIGIAAIPGYLAVIPPFVQGLLSGALIPYVIVIALFAYYRRTRQLRPLTAATELREIKQIYQSEPMDVYKELLANKPRELDVMAWMLAQFLGLHDLPAWRDLIAELTKEGEIRLLAADPRSAFSVQREIEEDGEKTDRRKGRFESLVKWYLDVRESLPDEAKRRFRLKLYSTAVSTRIFRADGVMIVGPYLFGRTGRNCYRMRLGGETSILRNQYLGAFKSLWEDKNLCVEVESREILDLIKDC